MKRKNCTILALSLIFVCIIGCGGYHSKNYTGPKLDRSEVLIITTDDQFVTIAGVDGEKIKFSKPSNLFNGLIWGGRFPRTISVLPGQHTIWPCYQNPYETGCAVDWIYIETAPGQSYIIKHKRSEENNKKIEFRIEKQNETDRTTHQKILDL